MLAIIRGRATHMQLICENLWFGQPFTPPLLWSIKCDKRIPQYRAGLQGIIWNKLGLSLAKLRFRVTFRMLWLTGLALLDFIWNICVAMSTCIQGTRCLQKLVTSKTFLNFWHKLLLRNIVYYNQIQAGVIYKVGTALYTAVFLTP